MSERSEGTKVDSTVLLDQRMKKCAVCEKQIDLNDKATFKTGMHGGMHFYVCSAQCLWDYYK